MSSAVVRVLRTFIAAVVAGAGLAAIAATPGFTMDLTASIAGAARAPHLVR